MLLREKHISLSLLRKFPFFLFLFGAWNTGTSAYARTDIPDTNKIKQMLKIAGDSFQTNPSGSYNMAETTMKLSEEAGFKIGVAKSLLLMANCKSGLGDIPGALGLNNRALSYAVANGLNNQQNRALLAKGTLYAQIGSYDSAIACFISLGEKLSAINNKIGMAGIYTSIGNCQSAAHNFADADLYYAKAEELLKTLNNPAQNADLYNNMAANALNQNKYAQAIEYSRKGITILLSTQDSTELLHLFHNLGLAYSKANQPDSGLLYLNTSLRLSKKINDYPSQAQALFNIAAIYDDQKKYDEAKIYYEQSLAIDEKIKNWLGIFDGYSSLAAIYKNKNNLSQAYDYLSRSVPAHDSLINDNKMKTVAELNARFGIREAEETNKSLEKENSIQKLKIQRKNLLLYGGGGICLLLIGFGFLLIRNNRLKANELLMRVEQKQLLAQMNPHFIFNCLNSIQQYIVQNDTIKANSYLADFALLMRQTLENSKDGIISLNREIEYLENYILLESMRFENKFSYTITYSDEISINTTEIPAMIIQPFVENAIHHGIRNLEEKPGILTINFYKKAGSLYCEVDDNGIGMEESQRLKENRIIKYKSHGMDLTKQRLALVSKLYDSEYQVDVINKSKSDFKSDGTKVIIKFPIRS